MKQRYQILYKGIYSNRLSLIEYGNAEDFREGLELVKSQSSLQLLQTNVYRTI